MGQDVEEWKSEEVAWSKGSKAAHFPIRCHSWLLKPTNGISRPPRTVCRFGCCPTNAFRPSRYWSPRSRVSGMDSKMTIEGSLRSTLQLGLLPPAVETCRSTEEHLTNLSVHLVKTTYALWTKRILEQKVQKVFRTSVHRTSKSLVHGQGSLLGLVTWREFVTQKTAVRGSNQHSIIITIRIIIIIIILLC